MPKSRPPYPAEFRHEAVQMVRSGRRVSEVTGALGVIKQSLRTWVKQEAPDRRERDDGRIEVRGLTDLSALLAIAQLGADEHGVPLEDGGLHAGEWETSMLEAIHPELVHRDRGETGYTCDPRAAIAATFGSGVHTIAQNGVIGDPRQASAEHGGRYWDEVLAVTLAAISGD